MTQPISFRLRCDRHGRYYRVLIFPAREAMYQHDRRWNRNRGIRTGRMRFLAIVHSFETLYFKAGRWHSAKRIGDILFQRENIGVGIVSHEMTHAARYYLQAWRPRLGWKTPRFDETMAWVQGELVRQFWCAFYRRKLGKAG
jgi:hypothetical protein